MSEMPVSDDQEWERYRVERDRALATKATCCPRPPSADALLPALVEHAEASERYLTAIRGARAVQASEVQALHADVTERSRRISAVIGAIVRGLDADTCSLVETTICEAQRAGRATSFGGMIIDHNGGFQTAPPLLASASQYIRGVMAWAGLNVRSSRAQIGAPSVWRVVSAAKSEAGRRRRRPRTTMWGVTVPHSAARDRADRVMAWLAEDVASRIDGVRAVPSIAAQSCTAGEDCRGRMQRIAEAQAAVRALKARRDRERPAAVERFHQARARAIHHDITPRPFEPEADRAWRERSRDLSEEKHEAESAISLLEFAIQQAEYYVTDVASRPVPAVTLRGRRGRSMAFCVVCKDNEKAVRDEIRARKGFKDPLGETPCRDQKTYRFRLEKRETDAGLPPEDRDREDVGMRGELPR